MKGFQLKKNSLPYLKCALRLSRVVNGSIYGRFVGFYIIRLTVFSVYKAQDIKVSERKPRNQITYYHIGSVFLAMKMPQTAFLILAFR